MKKLIMIVVMALVTLFTSTKTEARHKFHHRKNAKTVIIVHKPIHPPAVCKEVVVVKPRRELVVIKQRPFYKRKLHRERIYLHK